MRKYGGLTSNIIWMDVQNVLRHFGLIWKEIKRLHERLEACLKGKKSLTFRNLLIYYFALFKFLVRKILLY